jgi:hypothetical protein
LVSWFKGKCNFRSINSSWNWFILIPTCVILPVINVNVYKI